MEISSFFLQNIKGKPNEDFYLVSKKYPIFAVTDGVSRTKNLDGSYPKIPGARLAAKEFCKITIDSLEKDFDKADLKTFQKTFNIVNKAIFNLNEKYGINKKLDYLVQDYFCTCGVAAFIKRNILYYSYIGDCGIRIYNQNDFLKFISLNDVDPLEEWRDNKKFKSEKECWILWRKFLRNRPDAPYLTYGIFTGEKEAENYYHLGKVKIGKGDLVFLHSDGFLCFIKKTKFRNLFRSFKNEKLKEKVEVFVKKEIKANHSNKEIFKLIDDDKTLISILI